MLPMGEKSSAPPTAVTGRDAQKTFKPLSETAIAAYTDAASFSKGRNYALGGYISDPVLRGDRLRANSAGSSGGPYRVEVTLVPAGAPGRDPLASWSCSCPRGGFCKHVVALLLVWVTQPDTVEVRGDILARLQECSREELLTLIGGLLKREPDLDGWIELMLPAVTKTQAPGAAATRTVNEAKIQRRVESALQGMGYGWGESDESGEELDDLVTMGDTYAAAGQWANAQAVYTAILEEIVPRYEELDDEDGAIGEVVTACGAGLRQCLEAQAALQGADRLPATDRLALLRTLLDVWELNQEFAIWEEVAELPAVLARGATAEERAALTGWIREGDGPLDKAQVEFLLALKQASNLSPEEILAEYRAAGLYDEVAGRLIDMGRVAEALALAKDKLRAEMDILPFAEQLAALGSEWQQAALALIADRLGEEKNEWARTHYLEWLERHYLRYGLAAEALATARRRFEMAPGKATYEAVQAAATLPGAAAGGWDALRPELIATLERQGDWDELIDIYLQESQIPAALAALAAMEKPRATPTRNAWGPYNLDLQPLEYGRRVAEAAEATHPREALAIYKRLVEQYIDLRGRESYQRAAEVLLRVKKLDHQLGQGAEWVAYIADLRTRNKSLRALKEELDRRSLT
ncbi:MAG TPA: SWIM zinc finger family protein [Chloroflexia bacterium]|nr:SWIM zinc finger family protein [Chloroflexia bacterium]